MFLITKEVHCHSATLAFNAAGIEPAISALYERCSRLVLRVGRNERIRTSGLLLPKQAL